MGEVYAISYIIPGAVVSVSDHIVKIEIAGSSKWYDALDIRELKETEIEGRLFTPLISVPDDAPRPVVLVRCEMQFEGDFTQRALRFVKQGAHYTTTIQGGLSIPGEDDEAELHCDMGYVLKEIPNGAVLLGVVSVDLEQ